MVHIMAYEYILLFVFCYFNLVIIYYIIIQSLVIHNTPHKLAVAINITLLFICGCYHTCKELGYCAFSQIY